MGSAINWWFLSLIVVAVLLPVASFDLRIQSAMRLKGSLETRKVQSLQSKLLKVAFAATFSAFSFISSPAEHALATDYNLHPVVVLGSGGKTGKQIVDILAREGIQVRPTLRDPNNKNDLRIVGENILPAQRADVTKLDSLEPVIKDASAVIFAASASSKGGNAEQVDFNGVKNVANECVRLNIPRLVVISSGAITRPDSLGFKITNIFGGIMDYKLKGEYALKEAYSHADEKLSYAIIRPGGLLDGKSVGPSKIEVNQGDTISGEVNRADVAECAAAAATSKSLPSRVTFEVYEKGKSGPLEGRFPKKSGYEQFGNSYEEIFGKLIRDESSKVN